MHIFSLLCQGPNAIGVPLGILQLVLQCKYRKRKVTEEPNKQDLEKGDLAKEGIPLLPVATMDHTLNRQLKVPYYEASAATGHNVITTLKMAVTLTVASVQKRLV